MDYQSINQSINQSITPRCEKPEKIVLMHTTSFHRRRYPYPYCRFLHRIANKPAQNYSSSRLFFPFQYPAYVSIYLSERKTWIPHNLPLSPFGYCVQLRGLARRKFKDLSVFDLNLNRVAGSPLPTKRRSFWFDNLQIRYFCKVAELCSHKEEGLDPARGSGAVTGFRMDGLLISINDIFIILSRSS